MGYFVVPNVYVPQGMHNNNQTFGPDGVKKWHDFESYNFEAWSVALPMVNQGHA